MILDTNKINEIRVRISQQVTLGDVCSLLTALDEENLSVSEWTYPLSTLLQAALYNLTPIESVIARLGEGIFDPEYILDHVFPSEILGDNPHCVAWSSVCLLLLPAAKPRFDYSAVDLEPAILSLSCILVFICDEPVSENLFGQQSQFSKEFRSLSKIMLHSKGGENKLTNDFQYVFSQVRNFVSAVAKHNQDQIKSLLDDLERL